MPRGEGDRVWAGTGRAEKKKMAHTASDEKQTNHFIDLLVAASERERNTIFVLFIS